MMFDLFTKSSRSDVKITDHIELRLYEAHRLRRRVRIGLVRFRASQVDATSTKISGMMQDILHFIPTLFG